MKSRGVVGKRIVAIEQRPFSPGHRRRIVDVTALVLEDGTRLEPMTHETEYDYYAHTFYVRRPKKETT